MNFVDDIFLVKWFDIKLVKKEEIVLWKRIIEYEWYFVKMFFYLDIDYKKLSWKYVIFCNMIFGYRLLIYFLIFKIVIRYRYEFKF